MTDRDFARLIVRMNAVIRLFGAVYLMTFVRPYLRALGPNDWLAHLSWGLVQGLAAILIEICVDLSAAGIFFSKADAVVRLLAGRKPVDEAFAGSADAGSTMGFFELARVYVRLSAVNLCLTGLMYSISLIRFARAYLTIFANERTNLDVAEDFHAALFRSALYLAGAFVVFWNSERIARALGNLKQ